MNIFHIHVTVSDDVGIFSLLNLSANIYYRINASHNCVLVLWWPQSPM